MNVKSFRSTLLLALQISSKAEKDSLGISFLNDVLKLNDYGKAKGIYFAYIMKDQKPHNYSADLYELREWAIQNKRLLKNKRTALVYGKQVRLFAY